MTIEPRERLTEGITRERMRMELKRAARPTVVFVGGIAMTIAIVIFLLTHISHTFGHKSYEVRFTIPNDFGVFQGFDDVRFRGVPAGTIEKVQRHGSQLILVAKLQEKYGPVFNDARAEIRPITPLNDEYMDIVDPGTPKAGKATAAHPLPESQTTTSVTGPEVLDSLGTDQRRGLQTLLDQLGNGLADRGAKLRAAFVAVVPFLRQAGQLADQIELRHEATKRLIHNTGVLTTELGRRQVELKRLVTTGAATLGTLQAGSGDLDRTLAELGPTFTDLRSSLAAVRGAVGDVDTGLKSVYPIANRLPQSLTDIRRLNTTAAPAVHKLQAPIVSSKLWFRRLANIIHRVTPGVNELQRQVPTLNKVANDLVSCQAGVIGFFQWNSSLSKYGDKNGPIPRGNLALGVPDTGIPGLPVRTFEKDCVPGPTPHGIPTPKDLH